MTVSRDCLPKSNKRQKNLKKKSSSVSKEEEDELAGCLPCDHKDTQITEDPRVVSVEHQECV